MTRPPLPPFDAETAAIKTRLAENAWNSRDPDKVAFAYTPGSQWRNRETFVRGREEIVNFLTRKCAREHEYRLIKEVWAFRENRIAVRFAYEWHDGEGKGSGSGPMATRTGSSTRAALMRRRVASINDLPIDTGVRLLTGRRGGDRTIIRAFRIWGCEGQQGY